MKATKPKKIAISPADALARAARSKGLEPKSVLQLARDPFPGYDDIRESLALDPSKLTDADVRLADSSLRRARDEWYQKLARDNAEGLRPVVVVHGHTLLDPTLYSEHPLAPRKATTVEPARQGDDAAKSAARKKKGPGVIAAILEIMQATSADNPITREEVHAKLVERFPDRDAKSLMSTVKHQVPIYLGYDGHVIHKSGNKYWM